ncbi:MAG: DUF192 domain-containing protein [Patescibacteria group bacterium]
MNKNKKIIFIFLVIFLVGIIFIFQKAKDPIIERPHVLLRGEKIFVEIADTEEKREMGLSGRDTIGDEEGMLFLFPEEGGYGFWMKEMKFPIDIIWIHKGKIVWIEKNVDPQVGISDEKLRVYTFSGNADTVLEIKAGKSDILNLKEGDVVENVLYYN